MSSDWHVTTLGDICAAQGGAIQTGPFGSQLHTSDYKEVGIPVVMPTNIGDGGIVEDGIARIDQSDVDRLSQHKLKLGDIVFSRRGDVTKNALIRDREVGWFCGTGCLKVRLGDEKIASAKFISHCLRLPDIKDWLVRHAVGATMPNLNTGILSAVPINLPPLKVQSEIAGILDALDDRITLLRETNATLEAIAQALFKSWFVDFDPVRAKQEGRAPEGMDEATAALFPDRFEESQQGLVPRGWKVERLSDVLLAQHDRVGELLVPEYASTNDGLLPRADIYKKQLAASSSKNKVIRRGDLVFGLSRQILNFGLMREEIGSVSSAYKVYRVDSKKILPEFMARLIRTRSDYFFNAVSASSREGQSVSSEALGVLCFANPPEAVQQVLWSQINTLLMRIDICRQHADLLCDIRDTLLPRLISGQLRLPEVEAAIEEIV